MSETDIDDVPADDTATQPSSTPTSDVIGGRLVKMHKRHEQEIEKQCGMQVCNLGCTSHENVDAHTQPWFKAWIDGNAGDMRICQTSTLRGVRRPMDPREMCTGLPSPVFSASVNMLDAALTRPSTFSLISYNAMLETPGTLRANVIIALHAISASNGPPINFIGCVNEVADRVLIACAMSDTAETMSALVQFFRSLFSSNDVFRRHASIVYGFWHTIMLRIAKQDTPTQQVWYWNILVHCLEFIRDQHVVFIQFSAWTIVSMSQYVQMQWPDDAWAVAISKRLKCTLSPR